MKLDGSEHQVQAEKEQGKATEYFAALADKCAPARISPLREMPQNHAVFDLIGSRAVPEAYLEHCYFIPDLEAFLQDLAQFNSDWRLRKFHRFKPGEVDSLRVSQHPCEFILPDALRSGKKPGHSGCSYFAIVSSEYCNGVCVCLRRIGRKSGCPRFFTLEFPDNTQSPVHGFSVAPLEPDKRVFICEGVFDVFGLPNSISALGALNVRSLLRQPAFQDLKPEQFTIVFDNEANESWLLRLLYQLNREGYSVFRWPEDLSANDLNELLQAGYSQSEIQALIERNTRAGKSPHLLLARFELEWACFLLWCSWLRSRLTLYLRSPGEIPGLLKRKFFS